MWCWICRWGPLGAGDRINSSQSNTEPRPPRRQAQQMQVETQARGSATQPPHFPPPLPLLPSPPPQQLLQQPALPPKGMSAVAGSRDGRWLQKSWWLDILKDMQNNFAKILSCLRTLLCCAAVYSSNSNEIGGLMSNDAHTPISCQGIKFT